MIASMSTASASSQSDAAPAALPQRFADWFQSRGWTPRAHQLDVLAETRAGKSVLLIAPTGGGKTLAGFLPALIDLAERGSGKDLKVLYVSPLKALAVDIARNLEAPINEMGLSVRVETRTGDTPQSRRTRQKRYPPDILITTPEQIALMISHPDAADYFSHLSFIVLDELHALVTSKRGVLLSLGLARLHRFSPAARRIGLSATVADPDGLRAWLEPQHESTDAEDLAALVTGASGAQPDISILASAERVPWAGHSARYAMPDVYAGGEGIETRPGLRQHPLAGRNRLPGTVDAERGSSADRPPSRFSRCGPAAQGGSGHGQGCPARRGVYLDA